MNSLQLQDIHLPDSASFWPLAIGWWILIALVIAIATWIIIKTIKRAKKKKHQRKILAKFKILEQKLKTNPSNATIAEINTLIRQLAITYYPRSKVSSLTGGDWLHFLDESGDTQGFSRGAGRVLIDAPYQQDKQTIENLNLNEFIPLIQNWAKKIVKSKVKGSAHD
jgi:hypothetical protein